MARAPNLETASRKRVYKMGDALLTDYLDNYHPSTFLYMDSSTSSSHDELDLEMNRQVVSTLPPDINLPFSAEHCDILDVGLGIQVYETGTCLSAPKVVKKCKNRVDSIWGAWFFFNFYFKPVLTEKSKVKMVRDGKGVSGFDKSDLQLDIFMVQHDMENMYMWVFKEKPEHALGKMQLRSYMNGHSREGVRPFPFSADKGFVRSHRMQRKHYRGLSNPQCVHGIEVVPSPNLTGLVEEDRRRWVELTGRDMNFTILPEASDYGLWRNLSNTAFELEKPHPPVKANNYPRSEKLLNGYVLNLSTNHSNGDVINLSPPRSKRKKDFFSEENEDGCYLSINVQDQTHDLEVHPNWLTECSGVLRNIYGPVTAGKTIYEDEGGYFILVSLPFVDLQRVKVSWRNTPTHGIVKVSCTSTSLKPLIQRNGRNFKLTDPYPEHCPQGDFIREIPLSTRIPEDANIEAYYDGLGTVLEILVPKLSGPEEHEVRVTFRPYVGPDLVLN